MSYETFHAKTAQDAKAQMRRALGADAVVLSTRRHPDGSVEIRAIQRGKPLFKGEGGGGGGLFGRAGGQPAQAPSIGGLDEPTRPLQRDSGQRDTGQRDTGRAREESRPQGAAGALSSLRGSITQKLTRDSRYADPLFKDYQKRLGRHGISDRFVAAISEEAQGAPYPRDPERLAHALGAALRFAPLPPMPDRPIMLVGQTGAGKTSSAAKLAARAAGVGGKIAFISADVGRAGAVQQLTTYAEALDTRFWPVENPQDVTNIVRRERPQEALILDTPGVSPFARADVAAMQAFREALGAEPVLVIPASGDMAEHTDWMQAFYDIGVRRCIVTKFDTSRRVGAALSAAYRTGVALSHFSEAPFIADGLIDANPDYLAARLMLDDPGRIAQLR